MAYGYLIAGGIVVGVVCLIVSEIERRKRRVR